MTADGFLLSTFFRGLTIPFFLLFEFAAIVTRDFFFFLSFPWLTFSFFSLNVSFFVVVVFATFADDGDDVDDDDVDEGIGLINSVGVNAEDGGG